MLTLTSGVENGWAESTAHFIETLLIRATSKAVGPSCVSEELAANATVIQYAERHVYAPDGNFRSSNALSRPRAPHPKHKLYSDGSIEAQRPQGTLRSGSITDLRTHIEQHSRAAPAILIAKA